MCCLFGFYDYGHSLSAKQKSRLVSALAVAAEARGTDATGIAYLANSHLSIYKRPFPETSCQGLFNQIHKKATKKCQKQILAPDTFADGLFAPA